MPLESDVDWLISSAAAPWLDAAMRATEGPLALSTRLRKAISPERARLVIEQADLRRRAAEKFVLAERMFLTPRGLEQATDEVVARYKAARFPPTEPVADLCCGIGGDLAALAGRGPVTGVERDRMTAVLAEANLRATLSSLPSDPEMQGNENQQVVATDVAGFSVSEFAAWHIDPDRRPAGRRTTRVDLHEPGPEVMVRLLAECPNGAIKLAPAAMTDYSRDDLSHHAHEIPWAEAELEWISRKRQCRQLVAWFGLLAKTAGRRRATLLAGELSSAVENMVVASFVGVPGVEVRVASQIGRFVYEPDPAILAADLTGALAAEYGLQAVSSRAAYFTADERHRLPLLPAFEVLEVMPYQPKSLKKWLSSRGIGRLEVKKRGVELDPARVQRELHVPGDDEATLLLCRIREKTAAIVTRRL